VFFGLNLSIRETVRTRSESLVRAGHASRDVLLVLGAFGPIQSVVPFQGPTLLLSLDSASLAHPLFVLLIGLQNLLQLLKHLIFLLLLGDDHLGGQSIRFLLAQVLIEVEPHVLVEAQVVRVLAVLVG
jgi:hypothetical protein